MSIKKIGLPEDARWRLTASFLVTFEIDGEPPSSVELHLDLGKWMHDHPDPDVSISKHLGLCVWRAVENAIQKHPRFTGRNEPCPE
jgi:hypothetical protein